MKRRITSPLKTMKNCFFLTAIDGQVLFSVAESILQQVIS